MSTLFTFPKSGTAFTNIKISNVVDDVVHPPPRKRPKNDSMSSPNQQTQVTLGPRPIKITLESSPTPIQARIPALKKMVDDFIKSLLRLESTSPAACSYEDVHNACKILVLVAHQSKELATHLENNIKSCCRDIMKTLKSSELATGAWLTRFNYLWDWWLNQLRILQSTLIYLDLVYLLPNEDILPIWDAGLQTFENTVLESPTVVEKLNDCMRQWCAKERGQKYANDAERKGQEDGIRKLIDCITMLGRYEDFIEQPYTEFVSEFYSERSKQSQPIILDYLKSCIVDIAEEGQRGKDLLREGTIFVAGTVALQKLITPHLEALFTEALHEIISNRDKKSLWELNKVIERLTASSRTWKVSPSSALVKHFQSDILQRVKEIVTDDKNDDQMVDRLLELKEFIDECLSPEWLDDVEKNNKKYSYATTEAFEKGFTHRKLKPAEMIAKRIDALMKGGQKNASDADFFTNMKRVLKLYRFSPDKDVFRTFYTRALAKRLLLERSASDDFEKEVIKTLSESYDSAFGDYTQMFKDMVISKDLTKEYQTVKPGREPRPDPGLSVKVLQHSVWPNIRKVDKAESGMELQLPSQMKKALDDYEAFYKDRHSARRLTWAYYLATATLSARYPQRNYEISVSLYQAAILLLFNERDTWTVEEIRDRLLLSHSDLNATIYSLVFGAKPLIKRTDPREKENKKIVLTDQFSFNDEFHEPKKHKFQMQIPQQIDTVEETQQTVRVIDQYRDASIDAAIVRIMKSEKTLKSSQLINQTIEALAKHFQPEVKAVKVRIDRLIEGDYITRKDGVNDVFVYVA